MACASIFTKWWVCSRCGSPTTPAVPANTRTLGSFIGLALDIRNIASAAANLGYALVAFDFAVPAAGQAWTGLGLALIRLTDLTVSFALALWVALRSRGVEYPHWRELLTQVLRRVFSRGFLLPQWEPQQTPSA